jgi:hypothetical protein
MPDEIIENPDLSHYAQQNRDEIYRMLTGSKPDQLREMVRALGGPKAVAPLVGRTARTVERWITTTGTQRISNPKADARQALDQAFGQVRTTRQGRERIAASRRATLMRGHGVKMRGSASCGPLTPGRERGYRRIRTWDRHVDSATMDATFDAYIQGGEDAAYLTFNQRFGEEYGGNGQYFDDWMFFDMGGLGFTPDVGPGE